jgi:glucose-1-phosphate thymidylyltransferase
MFGSAILDAARAIEPSARGELEITDAIQRLIDDGHRVESHRVTGWWKDTGQLADMLEANRLVLEDIDRKVEGELVDSKVEGRVVIDAGARLERSQVRGPAIVGAGAVIRDAYVGPYTSVGPGVRISGSEVEHSILLEGASVCDLGTRMEASLLGRNVSLERGDGLPKTMRMIVGDNSEITIP